MSGIVAIVRGGLAVLAGVWAWTAAAQAATPGADLWLPPEPQVRAVLSQLPPVRAAEAGVALAQARSARQQAGPHEWVAKAGSQRRSERAGSRFLDSELGLETGLRWPAKVALDQRLGQATEQAGALAQDEAWHEAARGLLADWFDTLRELRTAQLLHAQQALLARSLAATQRRVELGEAAVLELLATQAEQARLQAQARRAEAQASVQRQALLRRYPGLQDPALRLPAADAPWPVGELPSSAPAAGWVARIVDDNHTLQLARAQAAQARLQAERVQLDQRPDPTVGVRAARERSGQEQVWGVYLSVPLGGAARQAEARMALAQAEVAAQELEHTRQRVEAEAWRVASEAAQAVAVLAQQRQALAAIDRSEALQARAYALGESPLGDWLLARRTALEARLAADTAALDALQAQARLALDAHELWPAGARR